MEIIKEQIELRKVLVNKMEELMDKDEKVVLVDADLMGSLGSYSLEKKYKERVINCGIMEAQEISAAAGMSLMGLKPFVHGFTAFASRRCLDQIFISSLYQKNPMVIIASDAGIQSMHNGGTHMSFEDMGVMRSLVNIVIIEPTDSNVLKAVLDEVYKDFTKTYWIRLTRKNVYKIYDENEKFSIGKAKVLKENGDITIFSMGLMVKESLEAAKMLEEEGINVNVVDMFTLKPIDEDTVIRLAKKSKLIISAENHSITNGLGSAIAEVLSEKMPRKLIRVGIKERFGQVGTLEFLQEEYKLRAIDIYDAIKSNI